MTWFLAHPFITMFLGWAIASVISLAPHPKNVEELPYFAKWGWNVMQFFGASLDKFIQTSPKFSAFQEYRATTPTSETTITKAVIETPKS